MIVNLKTVKKPRREQHRVAQRENLKKKIEHEHSKMLLIFKLTNKTSKC